MPRLINRLSAIKVSKTSKPGYYPDGAGLYLQVSDNGSKSWIFRFMLNRRPREMGLGSLNTISLAEAREAAVVCRKQLQQGVDPIEARKVIKAERRAQIIAQPTFDECAQLYIEAHNAGWRNPKHAQQWKNTLATYASPAFGKVPIYLIDVSLVMKAIEPIWKTKPETANRVRGRVEAILDWAAVRKFRKAENPARWRGNLDKLLPARAKIAKVQHHPALPYSELPAFVAALAKREGAAPKALEFIILTACRVGEAVSAKRGEVKGGIWTVPANRMKSGREHRVPLSKPALNVLSAVEEISDSDFIFPGWREKTCLTTAACLKLLRDMGHGNITTHGFRSTFRDWCAEQTKFPREIAEAALAHVLEDKTEAAYQRGDLLKRRAELMNAWATYCLSKTKREK
jgi:integrase